MFAMMIINGLFVMDYQLIHAQPIDIGAFIAIVRIKACRVNKIFFIRLYFKLNY